MKNDDDDLEPEYSAELIASGQRGKYAEPYRQGTNIVVIEPALHQLFPDSESVNRALREYAREHCMSA